MTLLERLSAVAESDRLHVVSDYDGVLSPIVNDPSAAVPDRRALTAFANLASLPTVRAAIVSGRSVEMLRGFIGDLDGVVLIGNHGASETASTSELVGAATADLQRVAERHPGAEVEPKPLGAALHVRQSEDPVAAIEQGRDVATRHGATTIDGKAVLELTFGVGDKGSAVAEMRKEPHDPVVFLGDDVTDEAVFRILDDHDVGVKVGPGTTAARFRIADQPEVAPLLEYLLDAIRSR